MPLFPQCVYSNPAGVPYTMTPNVSGWVAPYIPTVLPCCEMPQVRNFVEESILQGLETIITPLISTSSTNTTSILTAILADNTYNQTPDLSGKYTLTDTLAAIGSGSCQQVVLIAPVNGLYATIRSGGEMFIPPYSSLPVNVINLNQISARYATAGDFLSYYYH
jgi:hypothetical protein